MSERVGSTRWSLIEAAARGGDEAAREALAALCQIYWPAVYAFVRRKTGDVLRCEIAQTVAHPQEIDEEIADLFRALE